MAARRVSTPGAKTPEPTVETTAQPTTAEQADAALEHITGGDAESQDQSTNETSSLGTPVGGGQTPTEEDLAAKKEYEEFLEWRKNKGEADQPATQNVGASGADPTLKRTRQVVGPNGWTTEEF